jgi:hypothetical protein
MSDEMMTCHLLMKVKVSAWREETSHWVVERCDEEEEEHDDVHDIPCHDEQEVRKERWMNSLRMQRMQLIRLMRNEENDDYHDGDDYRCYCVVDIELDEWTEETPMTTKVKRS